MPYHSHPRVSGCAENGIVHCHSPEVGLACHLSSKDGSNDQSESPLHPGQGHRNYGYHHYGLSSVRRDPGESADQSLRQRMVGQDKTCDQYEHHLHSECQQIPEAGIPMIKHWNAGFWNLLTFAMQMVFILVTGFVLAYHPLAQRLIRGLTRIPSNGRQAVVMVTVVAMTLSWVQWGLGLVVGAILAREMARQAYFRGMAVHYPV